MGCITEYPSHSQVCENPKKRRRLSSSWDVVPFPFKDHDGENTRRRRKLTSSWDVLPCGLKVQAVFGNNGQWVFQNTYNCSLTHAVERASRNISPPRRADDKDGHFRFELGDNLTYRYRILGKMGEGTFGQVLECWDRKHEDVVAIKVCRGHEKYKEDAMIEIDMNRRVSEHRRSGSSYVQMREWFDYRNHICIVFEKLGPSLYDCLKRNDYRPFPLDVVREVGRQLLESVAYMHELNLVHTDLKPENILFVSSDVVKVPEYKLPNSNAIKLIDFGSTEPEHKYQTSVISTRHYRAPEVILGLGWDRSSDLWSVGCILVELCSGDTLFQTHENLEHLAMMERILGPLPYYMIRRSEKRKYFRHGKRLNWPEGASSSESVNKVRRSLTLRDLIVKHASQPAPLFDLLHRLLCFDPSDRLTAAEALRHPFFKDGKKR